MGRIRRWIRRFRSQDSKKSRSYRFVSPSEPFDDPPVETPSSLKPMVVDYAMLSSIPSPWHPLPMPMGKPSVQEHGMFVA